MTRLIDADALIEKLEKELEVEPSKSIQTSLIKSVCLLFCKAIELQPTVDLRKITQDYVSDTTIDAVPVIRCKDCKYWSTETEQTAVPNMHKCTWWRTIGTLPIDFCSRAERRGEHDTAD